MCTFHVNDIRMYMFINIYIIIKIKIKTEKPLKNAKQREKIQNFHKLQYFFFNNIKQAIPIIADACNMKIYSH